MTLVSTFAGSLGLSVHQQRIGFAVGIVLLLVGIGLVISDHLRRHRKDAGTASGEHVFIAVEAEMALMHEEASEMVKLLGSEWPYITPDGALVEAALPDWRAKNMQFIGTVVGSAQRAAYKGSAVGANALERLESEARFLNGLATTLRPDSIRVDQDEFVAARATRKGHRATGFLEYDHYRAPGAPPVDLRAEIDALMREGIDDLLPKLGEPVKPEQTEGGWKIEGGDAPAEWWESAESFRERSQKLLSERQPHLLVPFREGYNRVARGEVESPTPAPDPDTRSNGEKFLDLANFGRSGPLKMVQCCLEGLAAARLRTEGG